MKRISEGIIVGKFDDENSEIYVIAESSKTKDDTGKLVCEECVTFCEDDTTTEHIYHKGETEYKVSQYTVHFCRDGIDLENVGDIRELVSQHNQYKESMK